jgi:transcriptional regulator with XRE-family HTH domain
MDRRTSLGEFLRSRRARLQPADLGLPELGRRRRVPGLRREELAQLAGVSPDYYVRMEQGRAQNVSEAVLDAVASALRLDEDERRHLIDLARPVPTRRQTTRPQRVRSTLRRTVEAVDLPSMVLGRRCDVLAWNRAMASLITDFGALPAEGRNMARLVFLDDAVASLYLEWPRKAREVVGFLRLDAGRHPDDPRLAELIGELSMRSAEFRQLWAAHDVRDKSHGRHQLRHPLVGELTIDYETLRPSDDPDQVLVVCSAEPGSPSESALRLLTTWEPSRSGYAGGLVGDGQSNRREGSDAGPSGHR